MLAASAHTRVSLSLRPASRRPRSRGEVALLDELDVALHHLLAQLLHRRRRHPPQLLLRLRRVADQQLHLRRPEVFGVDLDELLTARLAVADLVDALALPRDRGAHA